MSHRFNRRQFLIASTTAIPFVFMDSPSRASSQIGRLTKSMPPAIKTPKISVCRPPIVGVPGVSYFKYKETKPFNKAFPGMHLFLDGRDVMCCADECDLEGGWVGVLWEKFQGIEPTAEKVLTNYYNPIHERYVTEYLERPVYTHRYIRGVVSLRRIDKTEMKLSR